MRPGQTVAHHNQMSGRPPRLPEASYRGLARISFTICSAGREKFFADDCRARAVLSPLLHTASEERIALLAYCVMPDHVHVLTQGLDAEASARTFVTRWKHATACAAWQGVRGRLWQRSYYDRVLRPWDETLTAVRYIIANPVRAGLASRIGEYPFAGSTVYTIDQLTEAIAAGSPERFGPGPTLRGRR
jgi:putative transposase